MLSDQLGRHMTCVYIVTRNLWCTDGAYIGSFPGLIEGKRCTNLGKSFRLRESLPHPHQSASTKDFPDVMRRFLHAMR